MPVLGKAIFKEYVDHEGTQRGEIEIDGKAYIYTYNPPYIEGIQPVLGESPYTDMELRSFLKDALSEECLDKQIFTSMDAYQKWQRKNRPLKAKIVEVLSWLIAVLAIGLVIVQPLSGLLIVGVLLLPLLIKKLKIRR